MRLNTISPSKGAKHSSKRLGRGIGSGLGKTSGRGHKGQKARSGCSIHRGFEGGQTPLYRRLPKFGFTSCKATVTTEIRLADLSKLQDNLIDLKTLKKANIIPKKIKWVKIILTGDIKRAITVRSLRVSKGAKLAIEAAGGKIE
ncbi:50S ribosomal protein L15 [Candidatus Palibaumannia cicadellinicola]|uniref:Large ribosomal subunit protein uL15 n=1 Tax=Baumannia cicadellinicola subsp. Homalodisca coagulata TaxID=374463 RepID=RL15_BAUCH|nr:50S ribosomal protein L15 [Candidatus Baumannia cicadellinicola]Q1LTB9.1 RecName: Full=Large ribosomal subunit protein uL15; AltName: Full=50S ribosomal protein L15 [Baumannia cicadellinicola str. Hc (Homalodisca coagulata)]ABF13806.1 ribosomal protein L15 [Baumannia cicadellinicola str. Hc (Homalodisca coagulata)]MCJ7462223.1 50S ribosomal protein L15 [Candidatus Baumannia cicadellinicola]MCJ7462741.1 50S ribosomal protein L15 [Candidatus Baumannia cicadellinicola]